MQELGPLLLACWHYPHYPHYQARNRPDTWSSPMNCKSPL